jgi:flagellar hook-associated protein 1 FlgK
MADLLGIGLSGLNGSRIGLNVAGQNISNIKTEGYSRQTAEFGTRGSQQQGRFVVGSGAEVDSVRRITNSFLVSAERSDIATYGRSETFSGLMDQLDRMISNKNSGLTGNLTSFFSSLQTAVDGPATIEARQVFLSSAGRLAEKFEGLQSQLSALQNNTGRQVEAVVQQISGLAKDIGELNAKVSAASSNGGNANDLFDKRDQALRELSKLIDINVVPTENNNIAVSIGSGQPLVVGSEAFELITEADQGNPAVRELAVRSSSGNVARVGNDINGGLLSGLLNAQYGVIDNALNNLGRVALGVSVALNAAHNTGLDLNNSLGGNLFTGVNNANSVANRTIANSNNALPVDQVVSVGVTDVSQLSTSDYRLTFTGPSSYVLTRLSDNQSNTALDASASGTLGTLPATLTVDGLTVNLSRPSGNFSTGDSFILRPSRSFADEIKLQVNDAASLALASPVRTVAGSNNTGTGNVSAGEVTDKTTAFFTTTAKALAPPVLIRFTSASTYDILDNSNPASPTALTQAQTGLTYPPASPGGIFPDSYGFQVEVTGVPGTGDTFGVDYNTGGVLDNRVGVALVKVQTTDLLDGGRLSIGGAYGVFTQEMGSRANGARNDLEASGALLSQSQNLQQSVSGVNLDEEAASLIQFEQAFNASAQVINVARGIFDTLLSAVR